MATVADLINTTRNRYLLGGLTEQRNKLAANYTAGATTIAFKYESRGIAPGALLSIGLNTFYVWAVDTTSNTATIEGGQNGTVDANALNGATINVQPRYTNNDIFNALNEDLLDLSSPHNGLYQIVQNQFKYSSSIIGYDLVGATNILSVQEIRYDELTAYKRTPQLELVDFRLERANSLTDYPSGYSLKLFRGGVAGQNVNVLLRTAFTPYAAVTDNVLASGISATMTDLPPMGAALRLLAGREVRRNQFESQGDTRRAEEVTPGSVGASSRGIAAMRQTRIQA
jgi:hypothetical protein